MDKKTRRPIVIVAMNAFRPGGSQTYALTLAQMLAASGAHAVLVAKPGSWQNKAAAAAETRRVRWREGTSEDALGLVKRIILNVSEELSAIRIRRLVKKASLIISSQPGPTAFFAKKGRKHWPGIPQMALVHGTTPVEWPFRFHTETIQELIGIYAATPETLKLLNHAAPAANVVLLGNLFRADLYWADQLDLATHNYDQTGPIVFLGTLTPNKTKPLRVLIQSMSINDLTLVVVGGGPDLDNLEQFVQSLGLAQRVSFVGALDDPRPWIMKASVVVTAGRGALESLSAGRSTIVATTDGVHGLVRYRDLQELESHNFTGRTPRSTDFAPQQMNEELAKAKVIESTERNQIAKSVFSVGSIEPIISMIDFS